MKFHLVSALKGFVLLSLMFGMCYLVSLVPFVIQVLVALVFLSWLIGIFI